MDGTKQAIISVLFSDCPASGPLKRTMQSDPASPLGWRARFGRLQSLSWRESTNCPVGFTLMLMPARRPHNLSVPPTTCCPSRRQARRPAEKIAQQRPVIKLMGGNLPEEVDQAE